MTNRIDWEMVARIRDQIKSQGLTIQEGAESSGIPAWQLYAVSGRNKAAEASSEHGDDNSEPNPDADKRVDSPPPSPSPLQAAEADEEKKAAGEARGDGRESSAVPQAVEELIVSYRRNNPDHGYRRIEAWLKKDHLLVIPRKAIRGVLKAHGLHTANDSSFDKSSLPGKGTRRFEAPYSGSLWQMDIAYVYISGIPVLYLVVIVDDYSRYCVGASLHTSFGGSVMIECLHKAIEHCGQKPRALLTDQGTSFYSWSYEPTQFQRYLDDIRVEHIVSDPHSPQTSGKVERLIQTIRRELLDKQHFSDRASAQAALSRFIHSYNHDRPHQSLGGQTPSSRFYGLSTEIARIENSLACKDVDFSRGYLILKSGGHTISVALSDAGIAVYLDGGLLRNDTQCGNNEHGSGKATGSGEIHS